MNVCRFLVITIKTGRHKDKDDDDFSRAGSPKSILKVIDLENPPIQYCIFIQNLG